MMFCLTFILQIPFMVGPVLRNHWWTNTDTLPGLAKLTNRPVLPFFPVDQTTSAISHFVGPQVMRFLCSHPIPLISEPQKACSLLFSRFQQEKEKSWMTLNKRHSKPRIPSCPSSQTKHASLIQVFLPKLQDPLFATRICSSSPHCDLVSDLNFQAVCHWPLGCPWWIPLVTSLLTCVGPSVLTEKTRADTLFREDR